MFGNLVNVHDLARFARRLRPARWAELAALLVPGRERRVKRAWAHTASQPTHWWDVPGVQERWNALVSGDPAVDHRAWLVERCLAGRAGLRGLSLGCGAGARERAWARTGVFDELVGCDLSAPRIAEARRAAAEEGLDGVLSFRVADVHELVAEAGAHDVVIFEHSLHHFTRMDAVLDAVARLLAPDGWLFLDEFVGPTRFQWTRAQLAAIDALLAELPEELRRDWRGDRTKRRAVRPSKLTMVLADPSEAVESARILPCLRERFELVELRPYGGTLLHVALQDIAQNFAADDERARRWLARCFEREDAALAAGLPSDFVVVAARPQRAAAREAA